MRLETSLRWVFMTWMSKEFKEKLKLVNQSALLFPSCQVWLNCTCHFNSKSSWFRHTKVGALPLILTFPLIMSTKIFKSLSTWRWWNPRLQASSIAKNIPHISAVRASQVPIMRQYPLSHLPPGFLKRPPQPAIPKVSLYDPSQLSLIHPSTCLV